MSCLVKASSLNLTPARLDEILASLTARLKGRVQRAYIFGSASTGAIHSDSDIDLILVNEDASTPFVQRPFKYLDLFDLYPALDVLVYTQEELARQLADSEIGFWKSVRLSMKQII